MLQWLFAQTGPAVSYQVAVHARGTSYLAGVINYGLGQGILAWMMAKAQGVTLVSALGRFALLAYHDAAVLLSIGLLGSFATSDLRLKKTEVFCEVGLLVVVGLAVVVRFLPAGWRSRVEQTRWGTWLGSWNWTRSLRLCLLRVVNFAISMTYAVTAMYLCGIRPNLRALCGAVPLIQLAEGLPITMSGLGTREATLLYLLNPERAELVLAFSLIWSTGLIVVRLGIGLAALSLSGQALEPVRQELNLS